MGPHVLLNLFNELEENIKCEACIITFSQRV